MKTDTIYNKDFLEGIKKLSDKSFNLIIADPPYNIGKADWDKIPDYINWCGKWMLECQRVLKDNGSFYWFHNDFLQIVEIQNWINKNSKFIFKQLIVWNKYFQGSKDEGFCKQRLSNPLNRNYYNGFTEYILFYTFQDETGSMGINANSTLFKSVKIYLNNEKERLNVTHQDINNLLDYPSSGGGYSSHYFTEKGKQWCFITKEHYNKLQTKTQGFNKKYGSLRREYEDLRYTFNNQRVMVNKFNKQDWNNNVWNYDIAEKDGHITPKSISLIENILKHSSNEGDIVLIPFVGSGNECIACKKLDRHYIGFEINKEYCKIAKQRLEAEKTLWD